MIMKDNTKLQSLSDNELLRRLSELLQNSRRVEADLIGHIAEVDRRRPTDRNSVRTESDRFRARNQNEPMPKSTHL